MALGGFGWFILSIRRDKPRISERRMNSCRRAGQVSNCYLDGAMLGAIQKDIATHLPDVTANLPGLGQEQQRRHPLVGTEAGLAREVVQVSDEPVQEVLQPFIFALVVDPDSIRRDVVDSQVQELWSLRVLSHGYVCHFGVSRYWHDNQVKKKLGILNPP